MHAAIARLLPIWRPSAQCFNQLMFGVQIDVLFGTRYSMIFIFISSDIIYSMTMVAPADGGRYRYCAPCPQVLGSCLDVATRDSESNKG